MGFGFRQPRLPRHGGFRGSPGRRRLSSTGGTVSSASAATIDSAPLPSLFGGCVQKRQNCIGVQALRGGQVFCQSLDVHF